MLLTLVLSTPRFPLCRGPLLLSGALFFSPTPPTGRVPTTSLLPSRVCSSNPLSQALQWTLKQLVVSSGPLLLNSGEIFHLPLICHKNVYMFVYECTPLHGLHARASMCVYMHMMVSFKCQLATR